MRAVYIIAMNTFREIIRDRILYGIVIFAILLIGLSLALGELSFAEQTRIAIDFGFSSVHFGAAILSIFVGSTLVAREVDKKTLYTLLVRPLSRFQFLIGKYFGLYLVITTVVVGLSLVLLSIVWGLGVELAASFFWGIFGILLETAVLLAIAVLLSTITKPFLVVTCSVGLFLIGHWLTSLEFFAQKDPNSFFHMLYMVLSKVIPDLEKFNWRSLFIYNQTIAPLQLVMTTAYALAWSCVFIGLAGVIFRRKEID